MPGDDISPEAGGLVDSLHFDEFLERVRYHDRVQDHLAAVKRLRAALKQFAKECGRERDHEEARLRRFEARAESVFIDFSAAIRRGLKVASKYGTKWTTFLEACESVTEQLTHGFIEMRSKMCFANGNEDPIEALFGASAKSQQTRTKNEIKKALLGAADTAMTLHDELEISEEVLTQLARAAARWFEPNKS